MFSYRTPPRKTEEQKRQDGEITAQHLEEAGPSQANRTYTPNVRKSIGEWETGKIEHSLNTSTPIKIKEDTQIKSQIQKEMPCREEQKITKPEKEKPTTTPKSPFQISQTKYASRGIEAKAMLTKAKLHLKNSRNLKTDIKAGVTEAIERLYQLVQEAERERKAGTNTQKGQSQVERNTKANPPQQDELMKNLIQKLQVHSELLSGQGQDQERRHEENRIEYSHTINQIQKNTRLLEDNKKNVEEIKETIEKQKEMITERITYASVAAVKSQGGRAPERAALHSVVISSEKTEETGDEILERVRKLVDAKEGWVQVEKVRKAKDRKIIMGCKSQEERRKIKELIEKAGQHLTAEDIKNKDPLLIMRDVLTVHTDEEILQALKKQNEGLFSGFGNEEIRVEIKYRRRARNPHNCHIVLSVSPIIWKRAIEEERVRIDLQRVRVEDQSPLVQCTRCLEYGHGRRLCKEEVDLCSHCGGPHLRIECPERLAGEVPVCRNCTRAKLENSLHNAFSDKCPVRKRWDELARASIAYC